MHKINVLLLGPSSFLSTLDELKTFLKFNPIINNTKENHDIILFHEDFIKVNKQKDFIINSKSIKICLLNKKKNSFNNWDAILELPTTLKEINSIVENITAKKKFNKNSSIQVKNYLLNKNEKKL